MDNVFYLIPTFTYALEVEKYYKKRKQDREISIDKKSGMANRIIFIPFFTYLIFAVFVPMILYVSEMLKGLEGIL